MPPRSQAVAYADAKEPSVYSKKCLKRTSQLNTSLSILSHSPTIFNSGYFISTMYIFLTSNLQSHILGLAQYAPLIHTSCTHKVLWNFSRSATAAWRTSFWFLLPVQQPLVLQYNFYHSSIRPSLFQARKNPALFNLLHRDVVPYNGWLMPFSWAFSSSNRWLHSIPDVEKSWLYTMVQLCLLFVLCYSPHSF